MAKKVALHDLAPPNLLLWPHRLNDLAQPALLADLWHVALVDRFPLRRLAASAGYELAEPSLADWAACFPHCFVCGKREPPSPSEFTRLHVHHIQRRGGCYRPHRDLPINLMKLCLTCHEQRVHGQSMSHAEQLAWKWRNDPCGYGMLGEFVTAFLRVADPDLRAPQRVTVDDVSQKLVGIYENLQKR